jgi:nitroreductase
MELRHALRTTGASRSFTDRAISRDTIAEILDDARFAPSGGNRQAWRVIVVEDPAKRLALRDIYLDTWHDYIAHILGGLIPFSPLATDDDRAAAAAKRDDAIALSKPDGFAETLHDAPVLLVVLADLSLLAALDRDLERYQFAGGGSIYPFVWNIILAARDRGLGGVMTTMAVRYEDRVCDLFDVPEGFGVAAVVALGEPTKATSRLTRQEVASFATYDSFSGPAVANPNSSES